MTVMEKLTMIEKRMTKSRKKNRHEQIDETKRRIQNDVEPKAVDKIMKDEMMLDEMIQKNDVR